MTESSYVGVPVIAFCNTDTSLRHIDIAIPCNNKSVHSIGLMWWMLAREVLRMRGTISRELPWEATVMPDLFFYRDPEEVCFLAVANYINSAAFCWMVSWSGVLCGYVRICQPLF